MKKNKQKWISDKIKKFKSGGKTQEESIAMAYASYNNMLKGGTYEEDTPKYQQAGVIKTNPFLQDDYFAQFKQPQNQQPNLGPYYPNTQQTGAVNNNPPNLNNLYNQIDWMSPMTQQGLPFQPNMPTTKANFEVNSNQVLPYNSPTEGELNMMELEDKTKDMNQFSKTFKTESNNNFNIQDEISRDYNNFINEDENNTTQNSNNPFAFNPFGGISLEQSLTYAGQGFGSGQTGKGIMGSALAGLKGARTFMSGFATGNEDQRLNEEYKRKMQQDPRYIRAQQGGTIERSLTDEEAYANSYKGNPDSMFTSEGIKMLGFMNESLPQEQLPLDMGKFKGISDYYNVSQRPNGYVVTAGNRNIKDASLYKDDLQYLQELNPKAKILGIEDTEFYQPLSQRMKQGGDVTNKELLTGEYLVENPNQQNNVELEDGEHLENSQTGEIQEVVGEKHDDGGVKTNLPDQSKVISDYTKIGKDNAKKFKDEFDVKVRATDTFATVLDRYNKKIGLDALIEEEKEIFEKIETQDTDNSIKENVKGLNLKALQKRLQEIESEKGETKVMQKEAFDKIFEEQEKIPKKKEKDIMKEGGIHNDIDFLSKKYKIDKDRLITLMQEGGVTIDPIKVTKKEAEENVKRGIWEDLGNGKYRKKGIEAIEYTTLEIGEPVETQTVTTKKLNSYKNVWESGKVDKNKYPTLEKFVEASEKWWKENPDKKRQVESVVTTDVDIPIESVKETIKGVPDEFFYVEQEDKKQVQTSEKQTEEVGTQEQKENKPFNMPFIPQDFILPPSARQDVYKQSVEFGRVDPIKVSAEPNLVELERQRQALEEAVKFLPPAQAAALMAKSLGQTQNASNKAISTTEITNAQAQNQADIYNLGARAKEDLMNIRFEQDYENKTTAAVGNQEKDIRQYFNDLNNQQRYNFDYIERRNLLNQAYPQFNVQGNSNIEFAGAPEFKDMFKYFNDIKKSPLDMTDEEYDQHTKTFINKQRNR